MDSKSIIEVEVSSPVFVQGKLPDEIVFFTEQTKNATTTSEKTNSSSVLNSTNP